MRDLVNTTDKMTSLAIAELTGKQHHNVMKAIRSMENTWIDLGQVKFNLSSYINSQNRAMPMYELSKTETLYIATKFNDEARAKLILRWEKLENEKTKPMTTLDMVQASINAIREQEKTISEHDERLKQLEAKTTTRPEYFTIAGYGSLNGVSVNLRLASKLGKRASKLCKERNLLTDTIPDARFGKVKMYPKEILNEVFNETIINKAGRNNDETTSKLIRNNKN
tara:strand:- start:3021 stop:3695 length:675 start_codon:yes stop_codon:yes gene_type:complete